MKKILLRISLLFIVLAAFIYFFSKNLPSIQKALNVTLSESLETLVFSIVFFALGYMFLSYMNITLFQMTKIRRTLGAMIILRMSSLAANALIPSGGLTAGFMFADDAKDRGESGAAAVTSFLLSLVVDYTSTVVLLMVAMAYLASRELLGPVIIIPAVAYVATTFGLFMLIYFSSKNKPALQKFLDRVRTILNRALRFFKVKPIGDDNAISNFVNELEGAYISLRNDPRDIYIAFAYMFLAHSMFLTALYILFLSFGISLPLLTIVSGYAIGMMVVVISPTANGVGFVEGAMALAYTSMGVPGATAITIAIIFRLFSFWLPMLGGFIALQRKHLLAVIRLKK